MAGSSAQVTFAFLAKDAASSTIRGLSKTLGGLKGVAGKAAHALKIGFLAAGAAIAGIAVGAAALAVKFTKAAIEDEAAQSKLVAVLKARHLATKENLAATEEAIKAGAKLAFSDDEVRAGIATATQFTNNFSKSQKILAAAQDLARAKGIPLEKATLAVGRAYNGSTTALSRMGIQLEKGAKGTAALEAVTKKFGGSAEAYSKTTAGSIEAIKIQLQEAGESIGGALIPIVNDLLKVFVEKGLPIIMGVVDAIKEFITNNRELIASVVETVAGFVGKLIPVLVSVGEFIFGTIIPAVVGFVQGLTAPGGLIDSVMKVVGPIINDLIPVFQKVVTNVVDLGKKIFELVGILWGDGNGPLAAAFKGIMGVVGIVLNIFGDITGVIGTVIQKIIDVGKAIMDSPLGWLIKAVAGFVGGVAGGIGDILNPKQTPSLTPSAVAPGTNFGGPSGYSVSNNISFGNDAYSSIDTKLGAAARTSTGTRVGGR